MNTPLAVLMGLLLSGSAIAQESPNYRLSDQSFNAGGQLRLASASYQMTFLSVGEGTVGTQLASPSYSMDGSFAASYPPPGEVMGLYFADAQTLSWNPERSVGSYNLYRNLLSDFDPLRYGTCEQWELTIVGTTDSALPPSGDAYFYLVTAENRLGEEGTKGIDSAATERPNPDPCP